jgi:AcrR family transcriptional regulator
MDSPTPSPPRGHQRGRPSRTAEQIEDMKARIIDTAYQLFLVDGFDAVSMRRLAAEVGCTVMTVYNYYPRKIDILRGLWARVFGVLFEELATQIASIIDPAERLRAVAMGYVQFWLNRREHYFLVFMSSNVEQSDVSIFVQDDALLARFDIFRQCIAEASLQPLDAQELELRSELLLCALNGISQNLITISGYAWAKPETLVDAAVHSILRA